MRKYSKETYRLRALEVELNLPLVSCFIPKACELLKNEYPEQIDAYFHYKDINKEYKGLLNSLKKKYGKRIIRQFASGDFKTKEQVREYKEYLILLDKRRIYNDAYKFIKPLIDNLALKMYKTTKPPKQSKELKEFLHLLKGLVLYTLNVFYKQPVQDEDFIDNIYHSCYLAYIKNYDRKFKKVDTFFTTHIINELSHINDKEIPTDDFSKLDSSKKVPSVLIVNEFNNDVDKHLSWELASHVL